MLKRIMNGKPEDLKGILFNSFEEQKTTLLTQESFDDLKSKLLQLILEEVK